MKKLIGKTGRVLRAVGCRIADREKQGVLPSAFQLALKQAVERAVQGEAKANIQKEI